MLCSLLPCINMNQPWMSTRPLPPSHASGWSQRTSLSSLSHEANPHGSLSRMILYTFPCYSLHSPHPSPHCIHKRDHSLRIPILRKSLPQTHLPDFLVSVFLHPLLLFTLKTKNKPTKTLRHTSQIILAPVLISQATEPLETEGHKNAGHLNCLSPQVENNLTASFLCLTTGRWHVKFSKSVHSFFFSSVIKSTTFSWVDLESDRGLTSGTDKPRANLRLYAGLTTLDKTSKFKADPFTAGFSTPTLLTFGTGCFSVVGAILGSVGCLAVSLTHTPWIPVASCQLPTKYPCRPQIHLQVFPGGR